MDGSADKSTCCQEWWPELNPQDPHSGRRQPTAAPSCPSCPLTSSCGAHGCTHRQISVIKNVTWGNQPMFGFCVFLAHAIKKKSQFITVISKKY